MAYVEVKAKTVEMAIEAAMRELGVTERDRLEIEVIQQPERGFLGFGGQDAVVKVSERSDGGRRGPRKRSRSRKKGSDKATEPTSRGGRSPAGGNRASSGGKGRNAKPDQGGGARSEKQPQSQSRPQSRPKPDDDRRGLEPAEQEPLVAEFISGLLDAFGLEGEVQTRMDEDVVVANVVGEQTEALVGPRGSVMEAVHELTKTVLQRSVREPARVRIDIAGYAERRRQALTIYAGDLIQQVLTEGGELMLEPMSAADRKVIHDAVAAHEGVRSYSEGEAPTRYVVIAAEAGSKDREAGGDEPEPERDDGAEDDMVEGDGEE